MDTSTWKWFRYDEIFDIKHGFYNKKPEDNPEGDIPFIGATDSNNGVTSHSDLETIANTTKTGDGSNSPMEEKIFENCIAVTNNGSVGYAYYQAKPFTCTHDVNPLYLKGHEINPYIALFLCTLIEKERFRWAYGRKWRPIRMPSSKIKLPVTPAGTPDWKFMEDFVKDQIIPQLPKKAQRVWLQKYDTKPMQQEKMKLNTQDWKWFRYDEIFDIQKGKRLTQADMIEGNIHYIGAIDSNNGLSAYIGNDSQLHDANTITVSYNGSIGYAFYQDKEFWATDDVNVLYPKFALNRYIAIFLCTIIEKEQYRFCYGRKWDLEAMNNSKIKLPVTPAGTPDWQFMEDYIKSLPFSRNIEPSKPNEVVDELVEMKKEMIKMRKQLEAQQASQEVKIIGGNVTYIDNSKNYNIQK
ncbi:MAG: restriction endonuclease subunit S [Paludibacteraceae bacterium]|nr:restriction endonuclease subunit S [Paludibacteraceae bacterium]